VGLTSSPATAPPTRTSPSRYAADINAALNGLIFSPAVNFNGVASLQIVTNDKGQAGSGGSAYDTGAIAINVPARTMLRPIASPRPSVLKGATLEFSARSRNRISNRRHRRGLGGMRLTLTASIGTLTLASTTGLTFRTGTEPPTRDDLHRLAGRPSTPPLDG